MIHFTSFILLPGLLLTLERSAVARTGPSQQPSHVGLRSAPNPFQSARFQPSSTIQGLGTASIGADVIYNNTSPTGLYVPLLPGESVWDSGYLSGPGFPWVTWFGPGCASSSYTVTGLEFGYVTDQPTADIELYFKHQYDTCQAVVPVPDHVLSLNGLPGSTNGAITGWITALYPPL